MKKSKSLIITIIVITLSSCSCGRVTEKDAIGMYISKNNINTIDTVWLNSDYSYINCIYRKPDNSLIYRNTGSWKYEDGYVIFNKFYSDQDDIHSKSEGNFEEVLSTAMLPLEIKSGNVIIHHKTMYDNIYLEKQ